MFGSDQVTSTARIRRAALLAGSLTMVGLAVATLIATQNGLAPSLAASCGVTTDSRCEETAVRAITERDGVKVAATQLLRFVREHKAMDVECHRLTHDLGHVISVKVLDGAEVPPLDELWIECGYGLLHGMVGNLPVGMLDGVCSGSGFMSTAIGECYHATGHAAWAESESQVVPAIQLCNSTFTGAHAEGCRSGVYMKIRDGYYGSITSDPKFSGEWVVRIARSTCSVIDGVVGDPVCVSSFSGLATKIGGEAVTTFLGWCYSLSGDLPSHCAAAMGMELVVTSGAEDPAERLQLCVGVPGGSLRLERDCLLEGALGVRDLGRSSNEASDLVCKAAGVAGRLDAAEICASAKALLTAKR